MLDSLNHAWRMLATGLCFVTFGAGALVLGTLVFPLMRLLSRTPHHRTLAAKWVIHHAFRLFIGQLRLMGVLSYEVRGLEHLHQRGRLILANHPTLIDVVFLMSLVQRADCIVKGALARNPFIRGPVRAAGFVFNDSGAGLVEDCIGSVRAGNNMIIFPEGTRSAEGAPLHFHRGAARVAVHGEMDITPVRIRCSPATMGKGGKWYRVPRHKAHFQIDIGAPIAIAQFVESGASPALAARELTRHLMAYFSKEDCHAVA